MSEKQSKSFFSWLKKYKRVLIGIGTIILILIMAFFVDFRSLIDKILTIGIWGTLLFVFGYTIAFIIRSYKLNLIFKGLKEEIPYSTAYFSIGISFVINDLTPAKIGDLAKMVFIKDRQNIKLSDSICGIAIERFLDLIILFGISCFAFIYLYITDLSEGGTKTILGQGMQFYLAIGTILLVIIIFLLILLIYKTESILNIIRKISPKIADLLTKFLINFKEGLKKFKDNKKLFLYIILLGIPTWIVDAAIGVIFFYFLGEEYQIINIFLIILAMILTFFSKTFPLTPGGWGVSENIGALFIFLFVPQILYTEILAIFIIDHLFRSAYLFFYGGYSIFHYNFNLKEAEQLKMEIS